MSVVVIGLNHRTVPLEILEQLAVDSERLPKALADAHGRANLSEVVVLSTCNRIEVYAYAERFHGAFHDVRDFLSELGHLPPEDFSHHLYSHYDHDAADHLFAVTCGLDSAVLGENEIQGQVREAWDTARAEGTCGPALNDLFRHALEVGKRARTETAISKHITSVSQAAVALAASELGGLDDKRILVLGAGEVGEGMAKSLAAARPADLAFVNRTLDRAAALARRVSGRALPLSALTTALVDTDVLLTSTGATALLVEQSTLAEVMVSRAGRPLLIVDVAMPRDIDPGAGSLDGITLLDMDDLRAFVAIGRRERHSEVEGVRRIIGDEIARRQARQSARQVAPLITSFRAELEVVRSAELARFEARLAQLDPEQRAAVDELTRSLLNKLAHPPTSALNQSAGSPRGARLADALRDLFDL